MSKTGEPFVVMTLEELINVENIRITHHVKDDHVFEIEKVQEYDAFNREHYPSGESQYRHCKRDLDKCLDDISQQASGWTETDDIADAIATFSRIESEASSAQTEADELEGYREEYSDGCDKFDTYTAQLYTAAKEDVDYLEYAVAERNDLIKLLKEQLVYCLQVSSNSLTLKQANELLLNLEEEDSG